MIGGVLREEEVGVVADRDVGAALAQRRDLLAGGAIGPDVDGEAGIGEQAVVKGHVQRRVINPGRSGHGY